MRKFEFGLEELNQTIPEIKQTKSNNLFQDSKDDVQLNPVVNMLSSKAVKDFKTNTTFEWETVHEQNLQDEINKILRDQFSSTKSINYDQLKAETAVEDIIDILMEDFIDDANRKLF